MWDIESMGFDTQLGTMTFAATTVVSTTEMSALVTARLVHVNKNGKPIDVETETKLLKHRYHGKRCDVIDRS
jgi:hypothetical protein